MRRDELALDAVLELERLTRIGVDDLEDHEVRREEVVPVQLVAVGRVGRDQVGISEALGDERAELVGEPVADGGDATPGLSAEQDSAET